MKPKHTFTESVRNHLKRYGSITQLQALERFGSWRLSATIFRLRGQGMAITTKDVKVKTRYGITTTVAKYCLDKSK